MTTSVDTAPCVRRTELVYLAPVATAAACSRRFVRQVCASWQIDQEPSGDAELIASELVTNAILASGMTGLGSLSGLADANLEPIRIRMLDFNDWLVIEVWDDSPQVPKLMVLSPEAEHGRGLQLVEALSINWGYYHARPSGKVVWCQLGLSAAAAIQEIGTGTN